MSEIKGVESLLGVKTASRAKATFGSQRECTAAASGSASFAAGTCATAVVSQAATSAASTSSTMVFNLVVSTTMPCNTPASMHLKAFRQLFAFQWLKGGYTLHVVTSGDSVRSLGLPLRLEGCGRRFRPLTLVDTLEYLSSSSRESSEPWFRSSSTCLLDVFVACADGYYLHVH